MDRPTVKRHQRGTDRQTDSAADPSRQHSMRCSWDRTGRRWRRRCYVGSNPRWTSTWTWPSWCTRQVSADIHRRSAEHAHHIIDINDYTLSQKSTCHLWITLAIPEFNTFATVARNCFHSNLKITSQTSKILYYVICNEAKYDVVNAIFHSSWTCKKFCVKKSDRVLAV